MTPLSQTAIIVFARGAEAETKGLSRSAHGAARFSELLFKRALQTVSRAPVGVDVVIAIDGHLPSDWIPPLSPGRALHICTQHGAGFEARILGALEETRSLGYQRLVVVGIDTPSMSVADLRRACEVTHPVLGPSTDGGFYLLGLNEDQIERLRGLPWCTERLLGALRHRFADLRLEPRSLRTDLDHRSDVLRQSARLERLALRLLGRPLQDLPKAARRGYVAAPRAWMVETGLAVRGPPLRAFFA